MIDWDAHVLAPLEGVFGEAVQYMPLAGGSFQIAGIYDSAYHELDLVGGTPVTTETPVLGVRLSQFSQPPKQGDLLTVLRTSETFRVKEVRPDSHGAAKLMLNQA